MSGQWKPDVTLALAKSSDGTTYLNVYNMQVPAAVDNQIVQTDELTYQGEAKCGLYVPLRPAGMDIEFTAAQEWRVVNPQVPSDPTDDPAADLDTSKDLWLRGWLVSTSFWSGMAAAASLRIKRKEGLELVSSPVGPFAPFATPALPNDLRAMQVIQEFCRTQPHAFTADHNELGTLLRKIVAGVGDALESLGLPVISNVAGTGKRMANSPFAIKLAELVDTIV